MRNLLTSFLLVISSLVCLPSSFYVSTTGSATNSGAIGAPWPMQYALTNAIVAPGDTLYLRGGTYAGKFTSTLTGTSGSPITVTRYANERPIFDGNGIPYADGALNVYGAWTTYRDFEVLNSNPSRVTFNAHGIVSFGPNCKFINLIVHDNESGIVPMDAGTNQTIYGCIIYNNGHQGPAPDRGHGHAVYAHSRTPGVMTLSDNIVFNQYGFGLHCYAETGTLERFNIVGNIAFNNGSLVSDLNWLGNILVGGFGTVSVMDATVSSNFCYVRTGPSAENLTLGYQYGPLTNETFVAQNNYLSGGALTVIGFTNLTFTGNTITHPNFVRFDIGPAPLVNTWDANRYFDGSGDAIYKYGGVYHTFADWKTGTGFDATSVFTAAVPTVTQSFVRANTYETGRSHVVIYNWSLSDNVSVDLSSACVAGTTYTVRNAANYFGPTVKTFTYSGSAVSLPMTNLTVATPVNSSAPAATGPTFNAFVIEKSAVTPPVTKTRGFFRKR